MAETPKVTTYDLTRDIPSGITVSGLSEPKSDGANYFRQPLGQKSEIAFQVDKPSFVQLEYQLYSTTSAVTGLVKLDGQELNASVFPAGKFVSNALIGDFVSAGKHTFEIVYRCQPVCQTPPSQYWTKLGLMPADKVQAVREVGLGVQQFNQYAPQPQFQLSGVGALTFDGVNFFRPVQQQTIQMTWPPQFKPLNLGFQVLSDQPFKVSVTANGKSIASTQGDAHNSSFLHLNLIGKPALHQVNVAISCLKTPQMPCARLYFPQIVVQEPFPDWVTALPLPVGLTALLLGVLGWTLFAGQRV